MSVSCEGINHLNLISIALVCFKCFNLIHLSHRDVLGCLAVVLEDNRDVHVDDDEEADDQVGEEEGDGHDGVTTVSLVTRLGIRWK